MSDLESQTVTDLRVQSLKYGYKITNAIECRFGL